MLSGTTATIDGLALGGQRLATSRQREITVRYGAPADADMLVSMYRQLSERTIRLRFGGPRPALADAALRDEMAGVLAGCVALVGTAGVRGQRSAVALAQLVQLPHEPASAEVALVVRDDYQREGIGRMLGRMLGDVASARGVRWLRAYTLAENQAVMRLIRSLGVPYTAETRRGETTVLLTLRQEA
ncbi:N-acetyltransferase family protein [Kouleothrix sp.]|uniref:GNAT family N-acetyltransferase n=1 Tax=Kouleothrix sp. TaxID=2779161 RepID=UPI003919822E